MAQIGPWARYGLPAETLRRALVREGDGGVRWQIVAGDVASGVVVIMPGWLAGPYLQLLAVLPPLQGMGAGARVLDWYVGRARVAGARSAWLCVSAFNVEAQRFYRRHGFIEAARLDDLVRDGDDEILMRKKLV
ncbi:MAG: GNAT family N-acetyltransferase [Hyphomicrobiaceae bacterium]